MSTTIKVLSYIFITVFAIVLLLPISWMILGAFRTLEDSAKVPPELLPEKWVLTNFIDIFKYPVLKWTLNSFIVAAASAFAVTLVSTMAGYAFAKKKIRGKEPVFWILLASIMIPGTATLIPMFVLLKQIGLLDSLFGLILPASFSIVYIYFFRQYVQDIPDDYLHSAEIDGAGELQKFFRIIIPLSKPAVMTMAILTFVGSWNNFVGPLMILFSKDKFTLPLGIQQIFYNDQMLRINSVPNYPLMQAAGLYMLLPMQIVFTLGHKYFVKGLWGGGIKE